ncbi:hypothetical protein T4E_2740 [Trichinella pseudospiralis]|uniref:Uncharacterized protein n=1 Tax=Trichinella pseudospiralis TaxID=6337 RepID=A0A0V0Y8E4_TRIPS|nr:hypothetical protein T4E_2740 [Trichinella pseudospiralis]
MIRISHAMCRSFCSINVRHPNWEFYPISQKFIDCGLLKIYIPLNGTLFLKTPNVLRKIK